jgi:CBS domain-containing protein
MTATRTPFELSQTTVGHAMHRGVITIAPDARVTAIAATMASQSVHAAVLVGPRREGALVVTDLDVLRAALRGGFEATAVDVAREPLLTVAVGEPLERAIALMATRDESHLLVSDPDGEWPAGVLSSLDVMAVLAGRDTKQLRIIRPAPARPLVSATALAGTTVAAVMHPGVVTSMPDAELAQLAGTMADLRIHCIAVVGADGGRFVWGLVTDMDVLHAAFRGGSPKAGALAVSAPPAVPASAPLDRAAQLMAEHQATHVIAVDGGGAPIGVISTLDVLRIVAAS